MKAFTLKELLEVGFEEDGTGLWLKLQKGSYSYTLIAKPVSLSYYTIEFAGHYLYPTSIDHLKSFISIWREDK